ncbi:MAG: arginyl-tRNA synthetase, partial [Flavobacteriaceae bacterium]
FSSWYGNTHILSEENQYLSYHIEIVQTVEKILSTCLHLLGAEEVEKM